MSPPFVLGAGARLVATTLPAGVVWRDGRDHLQAAVPNAAATRWTVLPSPPPGTEALAAVPAGALEALAVRRTTLTAWRLDQVADGWQEVQRLVVPIAFGSSG
jgi:hypothetical protein